jgi:SAM-dependent methyltransferase
VAPVKLAPAFVEIDGFRCFAPARALECADYPHEGFEVTAEVEANSFWCRSRNRILRRIVERFSDRSRPVSMLEIGCGIGGVAAELRRVPGLRLTASEISLQGLRYARSKYPEVEFIQLDAAEIPFREEFDVVGAFDVLEHIQDDERVIQGVHDALRPGGVFVVTVPQYAWMWSSLDEIVHHKRRYSRADLLRKLRAHDFEVLYRSSFVTALFPAMAASRLLARRRPPAASGPPAASAALNREAFASHVTLSPAANRFCDRVMRIDELALRGGLSLPFGGSLLAVARRS